MSVARRLVFVALAAMLASVWGDPAAGISLPVLAGSPPAATVGDELDDPVLRHPPKRLILKLREGAGLNLTGVGRRAARVGPGPLNSRIDALNRRYGARNWRPLARVGPRRHKGAAAISATRFARRSARAPRAAVAPDFSRTWVLEVRRNPDLASIAREYAADPAVEYCEPDYEMRVALVPNDPFFHSAGSWGQRFDDLWGVKRVGAPAAWDTTRGEGIVVAVVDTGIDYAHPDIAANVWVNTGEIAGNGVDDDGNGFVDDVHGWDFADDDADPIDDNGHGTHVAGTVAAVGDNGRGVVGVAHGASVMAVRGLGLYGSGPVSDLAAAVLYAVDNGADVINASWGGQPSQTIADAVAAAHAAGVVFVAAAGNSAADVSGFAPANDVNAIAVAAYNSDDQPASFTNFGAKIDVAAPGGGDLPPPKSYSSPSVLSLLSEAQDGRVAYSGKLVLEDGGDKYVRLAGTSMAAPHVSGAAALVLAASPTLSVEQVRQVLRSTAEDLGEPGPDEASGFGLIDAASAVAAPPPLAAHLSSPAGGEVVGALSLDIEGSATGPGFTSYRVEYSPADDLSTWTPIAGPVTTEVDGGLLARWDVSEVPDGAYVVLLSVERPGETFLDYTVVVLNNVVIDEPRHLAAVRAENVVEIRGTAAGAGFLGYDLLYRRPSIGMELRSDRISLAVPPGTPVRNGLLGTLDVSDLTEGDRFDFALSVTTTNGSRGRYRSGIAVDPTLRAGWPQSLARVLDSQYLTLADLDGDGGQEVLVGSGDEVVVFEHDGSVRPGWPQSVATPSFPAVVTMASPLVADVAGDATPEVIGTNRKELFVWSPDGDLLPGFPVEVEKLVSGGNDNLVAGDVDGDGKDDIVCVGGGGGFVVYRGDATPLAWSIDTNGIASPPAVANVLGGTGAELAWVDKKPRSLFGGRIKLTGPDGAELLDRGGKTTVFVHPALADMDGDGRLDIVVVDEPRSRRRVKLRAYTAERRRVRLRRIKSARRTNETAPIMAFADLDRDGRAEAYVYMRAYVAHGQDEDGFFVPFVERRAPDPGEPVRHALFKESIFPGGMAIGDVDGDGVQEFVSGISGNGCDRADPCPLGNWAIVRRAVVVAKPDGTLLDGFPKPVPQWIILDGGPFPNFGGISFDDPRFSTPAIGDLDGDGLKEVLWVDYQTARLFVWNVPGTPGPLVADWPMFRGDAKHSNTLPVTGPAVP